MPKPKKDPGATGRIRHPPEAYRTVWRQIGSAEGTHLAIGKVPAHLPPAEQKVWAELAKAAPKGLLQRSDRIFLELVARSGRNSCCLVTRWPKRSTRLWFNGPNSNVFCFDGAVPIDDNVSEREMKRECSIARTH
jgi:hypothetical protein